MAYESSTSSWGSSLLGILIALALVGGTAYAFHFLQQRSIQLKEEERQLKRDLLAKQREQQEREAKEAKLLKEKNKNQHKKNTKSSASSSSSSKTKPTKSTPTHEPRYLRRFGGHTGNITTAAVSPNGEWMATAGTDGQIRVTPTTEKGSDKCLRCVVNDHIPIETAGVFQDHIVSLSWEYDNRTITAAIDRSRQIATYRMRKIKELSNLTDKQKAFPYELAELTKRRFAAEDIPIHTCLTDVSHSNFTLILTNTGATKSATSTNTFLWDGKLHKDNQVGSLTTAGAGIRLSQDGRFLCGRSAGSEQVKLFEIVRQKVKGQVQPMYDHVNKKACMTLTASPGKTFKVSDVAFVYMTTTPADMNSMGTEDISLLTSTMTTNLVVVACDDGTIQLWDTNVEYKNQEDPKLLVSANQIIDKPILAVEAICCCGASSNNKCYRIAALTADRKVHMLQYKTNNDNNHTITLNYTIDTHHEHGVGYDLQFCPVTGNILYTRGINSRDVYAWKLD